MSDDLKYYYNTAGLVTEVKKNNLTLVRFTYNDRGHRVGKDIYTGGSLTRSDRYVRDASGSVLAVYEGTVLKEHALYGLGRLGVHYRASGTSAYQLSDHLGNVRAVVMKDGAGALAVTNRTDYYPGGMAMPNRNVEGGYRYGYQGEYAEKDKETGLNSFELRMYDSRINRWISPDPYGQYHSPYMAMGNNWINAIDPDGGWKTKLGQLWAWATNGFKGKLYTSDVSTGQGKFGIAFDYGGGDGPGDLTGTFMATSGAALDSWNMKQEWGNWRFTENGQGFEVAMMKANEPNVWGRADEWMNDNKVASYVTGAIILYNIADDAYVYGTRNFTTGGARYLDRKGASPKEQFDSGFNTFTTFFPTPLKGFRLTGARYNVATFGSTFKGTFLTKLKPSTRGLIIRYTNKATDQIHGKRILSTTKSVGESIKGD